MVRLKTNWGLCGDVLEERGGGAGTQKFVYQK